MKKLIFIVFIGTFSFLILSSEETIAFESTYEPGNSGDILIAVSYTHLTLPTSDLV